MALDSKAKRASIPGVGRPWYRTKQPAANSVAWRIASGNAYGGNAIAAATTSVGWTRSLTPSPVRPSYKSGFARSAADSAYPGLWNGLVGAWVPSIGNNGSVVRNLAGGPSATLAGSAGWGQSSQGSVVELSGSDLSGDAIDIPYTNQVAGFTDQMSVVQFLFHQSVAARNNAYFSATSNGGFNSRHEFFSFGADGKLYSWLNLVTGASNISVASPVVQNTWAHLAVTYNGKSGAHRIYHQGGEILEATQTGTLKTGTGGVSHIGISSIGTYAIEARFAVTLLYSRELAADEIRTLYRDPLAPFRQRRFTPTISGAAEAAAEWQPYWVPRMTQRIIGSGVR